jgi:putative ABC transport system permease protein
MKSERLYRRLLSLLPRELREGFGDDMTALFAERLASAGSPFGRFWIWTRACADLLLSAPIEHMRARRERRAHSIEEPRRAPMSALAKDIRYAVRGLIKNPGFALITIITLAFGIGASTVAFTLVNGVLIRPLTYPEPNRLVTLWERWEDGREMILSFPNFDDWRNESRSYEGITALRFASEATVLGGEDPSRGILMPVSREFFEVVGVPPVMGRPILPEENRQGGERVAVLSYEFWERTFGLETELDQLTVTLGGQPFSVVGVMPPGFKVLEEVDLYLPLELNPFQVRDSHNYRAIGRLAPGITWGQAQQEMDGIAQRIREAYPEDTRTVGVNMRPLRTEVLGEVDRPLLLLMGAAGLLLLLACSNVASTLLARGTIREREMAIRTAVGAGRSRLLQLLLTESLIVGGLAGLVGLGLCRLAMNMVRAQGMDLVPRLQTVSIDAPVLLFALGVTLVTTAVFGLLPALRASGNAADALRSGQRGDSRRSRAVGWNFLVGGEAALAVILVVAAGLLLQSLREVLSVDANFRPEGVLAVALDFSANQYETVETRGQDVAALKREFQALPGVTHVGFINHLPTEGRMMTGPVIPSPLPEVRTHENSPPSSGFRVVDEDYFAAMGIPLIRGRVFTQEDGPNSPPVIVLNQALAELAFPGEDPIGRLVQFIPFWRGVDLTVVGVVAEARDWRNEPGSQHAGFVFWPQKLGYTRYLTAVIRTDGDPSALVRPVRERLRAVSPNVPGTIQPLSDIVGESFRERTFTLSVLGAFAALSLLLSAVGIFGVVSYTVSRRSREIGIQLALGAGPGLVRRRTFVSSFGVVVAGAAVGLLTALAAGGAIQSLLYEVSPRDPVTLVAAPIVLLAAAALAIGVPVVRYTRVDPAVTMRTE